MNCVVILHALLQLLCLKAKPAFSNPCSNCIQARATNWVNVATATSTPPSEIHKPLRRAPSYILSALREWRYIGTIFLDNDALLISICAASTASVCFVNIAKGFSILPLFFIRSSHHECSWNKLMLTPYSNYFKVIDIFLKNWPPTGSAFVPGCSLVTRVVWKQFFWLVIFLVETLRSSSAAFLAFARKPPNMLKYSTLATTGKRTKAQHRFFLQNMK